MTQKNKLNLSTYLLNVLVAGGVIAAALWLITRLFIDGLYPLATILSAIVVFIAMIYLKPRFSPYRWLGIGIGIAVLFTIYPILYTVIISVTNMGSGHLMSKNQAISRLEAMQFIPENGLSYSWTAFKAEDGSFALWLQPKEGESIFATLDTELRDVTPGQAGIGELDEKGIPVSIVGYQRLARKDVVPIIIELSELEFGKAPTTIRIKSLGEAVESAPLYRYDSAQDVMINQQTGEIYTPVSGTFVSKSGEELIPGYLDFIGLTHFKYFLGTSGFREPLSKIFIWNIAFTFFSVFVSFAIGLIATIMFEDLPGRSIIRALLIIPWPIPVLVSVLIWRNMLHPDLGFVAPILQSLFGSSPDWFSNVFWTRFGIIMVNVWLSYPYFYVITAGAVRAIPEEIYSAAVLDGAGPWQKFQYITLPLLTANINPVAYRIANV